MTPAEFIAVCRRLGACEGVIARFKRRRGTVHQRLAQTAKASQRSTLDRETLAEQDLNWVRFYGPQEYARRLSKRDGPGFGYTYAAPKPKRRTNERPRPAASAKARLREVAERQREACARTAQTEATGATKCEGGPEFIAAAVRATPLVTEDK